MNQGRQQIIRAIDDVPVKGMWTPAAGSTTVNLRESLIPGNLEAADTVISEARQILAQCTPPTADDTSRIGLVCGYVQSGKTASMTAVSALAKDNGYRIIVLLAGVTTNLVGQNRERLESTLRKASTEWSWMMLANPKAHQNQEDLSGLVEEWHNSQYDESDRRTLFITVMKNVSHLRNLAALLSSVDLSNTPAIIFDDEADQASLNTRPSRPDPSATYREISALRSALPHHTYLQYTATPQAPLLITRIDALSADFAELVSPGEGYIGGQAFFTGRSPLIETIPSGEIFRDDAIPLEPPDSLLEALRIFFVGVSAGRCGEMTTHRSMLIHPSKATATHARYNDWANQIKNTWHETLMNGGCEDKDELIEDFSAAYDDLSRSCNDLPSFEQVVAKLPVALNQTAVTLVNSKDGKEVPWQNGYSHILVGGEKLGRGYTVKGLTVTYMPRSPGGWTADTIQQRARFFGYHSQYSGYCRVFLHPDVRRAYEAYVDHEEDMRARLRDARGKSLQEWRRMFYLDRRLAPTRRNVLSSPYNRPKLQDGWFAPKAPHDSDGLGQQNWALVQQLNSLDLANEEDHPQHKWAVVYLKEIYEGFLVPLSYADEHDSLQLCVANCNLKTLIDKDPEARCLVYFMSHGQTRNRTLRNDAIPQLFQGRSSAGAQSYPGDRAFCDERIPTIQIHILDLYQDAQAQRPRYNNVPAVAIKIPGLKDVLIHDDS